MKVLKKNLNKAPPNPEESDREKNTLFMNVSFQLLKGKYYLLGLIVA